MFFVGVLFCPVVLPYTCISCLVQMMLSILIKVLRVAMWWSVKFGNANPPVNFH